MHYIILRYFLEDNVAFIETIFNALYKSNIRLQTKLISLRDTIKFIILNVFQL